MMKKTEINYFSSISFDLLSIASLWIISIIIVNPFGDFPLNDDWSFGTTVKLLTESGEYNPLGWTSMPLITHVFWGYIFTIPAGFSFEALRFSTITISLFGILISYLIVRYLHPSRLLAVFIALTLGFNAIYFALSATFMTDVPFTAITIFALYFLLHGLKNNSDISIAIGTIIIVAATLNRQLAIAVPMAFSVAFILKNGFTIKTLIRAIAPLIICISTLFVFQYWLKTTGRLPEIYDVYTDILLQNLTSPNRYIVFKFFENTFIALLYAGLFLLPVLILVSTKAWMNIKEKKIYVSLPLIVFSVVLLSTLLFFYTDYLMPLSGNIINKTGVGEYTTRDVLILGLHHVHQLPELFWIIITAISLLGAVLLVLFMVKPLGLLFHKLWPGKMNGDEATITFLLLCAVIYMTPILIVEFFDRYLITAMIFIAFGISAISNYNYKIDIKSDDRILRFTATAVISMFIAFSVGSARDYLTWNRARWALVNDFLKSEPAKLDQLDGGFEVNGLYLYDPKYNAKKGKSWWWVNEDKYVIAFGPIPGYSRIKDQSYQQWIPPNKRKIFLLEKHRKFSESEQPH